MKIIQPRIVQLKEKRLVGNRLKMSFANNKTGELWRTFMSRRDEIINNVSKDRISMQVYPKGFFEHFQPVVEFEKWATVEVKDFENVPVEMEIYTLPAGLYAVFDYKGSSADTRIFQYIFQQWLPGAKFVLDDQPHFEVLGEKYKNADPDSEEEIWIPIRLKRSLKVSNL